MHGETAAVHLGRIVYRKRWEELLTETLYQLAPRGTWTPSHPAWPAARSALADALRQQSVRWLAANRDEIRLVVNEQSMRAYNEDERASPNSSNRPAAASGAIGASCRCASRRTACRW
jgi:hypothetical protein